jgi:hypothetical protein
LEGWRKAEDEWFDLITLPGEDGPERLGEWRPAGSPYVGFRGRTLFEIAVSNGMARIVVNLGSATGGSILRGEIEALARGRLP